MGRKVLPWRNKERGCHGMNEWTGDKRDHYAVQEEERQREFQGKVHQERDTVLCCSIWKAHPVLLDFGGNEAGQWTHAPDIDSRTVSSYSHVFYLPSPAVLARARQCFSKCKHNVRSRCAREAEHVMPLRLRSEADFRWRKKGAKERKCGTEG